MSLISESGRSPGGGSWQHLPVFLPGESPGQRNLAGYNPQDHKNCWAQQSTHALGNTDWELWGGARNRWGKDHQKAPTILLFPVTLLLFWPFNTWSSIFTSNSLEPFSCESLFPYSRLAQAGLINGGTLSVLSASWPGFFFSSTLMFQTNLR